MREHVRIVGQQHEGDEGVEGHKWHGDKVEVHNLCDELLASVGKVIVKGRSLSVGNLLRRLFQRMPRGPKDPSVGEHCWTEGQESNQAVGAGR